MKSKKKKYKIDEEEREVENPDMIEIDKDEEEEIINPDVVKKKKYKWYKSGGRRR